MSLYPIPSVKIGYSRSEFGKIFQIYSQNVYSGLFKDFSFSEIDDRFFISFLEEAGKTPLVTIEKRLLSADKSLFVATISSAKGAPVEITRCEKIDIFVERVKEEIAEMRKAAKPLKCLQIVP